MITVIADDFTGAAELGAIGFRYGLRGEIQRELELETGSELLVIDTDTRSRSEREARERVKDVAGSILEEKPEWIYKKVDSVMRGHILTELTAMMRALEKGKVLLIPANPSLGRTISGGTYFVKGRPLSETDFSKDPEYPATSSDVIELLGSSEEVEVRFLNRGRVLLPHGIAIGEAESKEDLLEWAAKLDEDTIPAGGSDFFRAILELKGFTPRPSERRMDRSKRGRSLFICGSGSDYSQRAIRRAERIGVPVCKMPIKLFKSERMIDEILRKWAEEIISAFERSHQVIATIGYPVVRDPILARRLQHFISALAEEVMDRISVEELYIEGGATASSVLRRLNWNRFYPCDELAPGVVRMRVVGKEDLYLTVKPGSYPWPKGIWK
ncbi:TPA: four-carbon acid sugar kinase family protein [Candidatus Poribacteria bacterium]|nr:four-carbon acid sugar kinase family protein [Candidatus Poribacteria bacterium]